MSHPLAFSPTLYVKNISDNIPIDDLKRELYYLFSAVAPVVDIQARKGKTRGMAWISFPTAELAQLSQQQFNGFNFMGRELVIEFAKRPSKSLDNYYKTYQYRNPEQKKEEKIEEKPITTKFVKLTGFPPKINAKVVELLCKQVKGYQKVEKKDDMFVVELDSFENAKLCQEQLNDYSFPGGHTIHAQIHFQV